MQITPSEFNQLSTRTEFMALAKAKGLKIKKIWKKVMYEQELELLQTHLVEFQHWVVKNKRRVAILFEGRDAAGKGGAIKRFTQHLNPRSMRVVALAKPTEVERGQWYFRRYIKELPNPGEIVFFDRSWYNRAVVEPVMGFCNQEEYEQFMIQVPGFEHMLYEDGVDLVKFWFSISKKEQYKRFQSRLENPLKKWKYSPVDMQGQRLWDKYTYYKELMFAKTHTTFSPWVVVKTNNKREARLESIRYVLSKFNYADNREAITSLLPDPNIVERYYRHIKQIDN